MPDITIFRAQRVVTMDPAVPRARAVAVRDGLILGVGDTDALQSTWGEAAVDDTFAGNVIVPGFVEAHSHAFEGGIWGFEYVGYFDRRGPDGLVRDGCRKIESLIARLRQLDHDIEDPTESLIVWGFDPIYFQGERLAAQHLDAVSATRPICVVHASLHLITVNTAVMEREGFAEGSEVEGVPNGADGRPLGELQEPPAMSLARIEMRRLMSTMSSDEAIRRFAAMARTVGCTTVTDLGTSGFASDAESDRWLAVTGEAGFPARIVPFMNPKAAPGTPAERVRRLLDLESMNTETCRFGRVKLILDGSIQGFTARLNPPGYLGDRPNGIWLMAPEEYAGYLLAFHRANVTVHTHVNGDEAVDLMLDTVDEALRQHSWLDHRHTAQHSQLTTPAQYRRMAVLGVNANIFSNHIFYWGDQHRDITVGPDRAARMNACATAKREGVRFSIHSDASVTPLGCLHTMWCAVNRVTASRAVLGPEERISVADAMQAVTIDAAFQLRLDHEIGSIEGGKRADFAVLADDPFEVDPIALRDIDVVGTVLGGRITSSDGFV